MNDKDKGARYKDKGSRKNLEPCAFNLGPLTSSRCGFAAVGILL
jgi:hypothetical protein